MCSGKQPLSFYTRRPRRVALIFLAGSALSGCGSLASLQTDKSFHNRIYAGAGILISQLEPDASDVQGVSVDETESSGAGVLLGYDITDRFAIEGHLVDLGESTFSPDGSIGYQVGGVSGIVYGLNSKHNRQRRQGFSAYGRLGFGALNNEAEGVRFKRVNDAHLLAGAGLEYGFEEGLAARLELVGYDTDASSVQLSVLYRFGGTDDVRTAGSQTLDTAASESEGREEIRVTPVPGPDPLQAEKLADEMATDSASVSSSDSSSAGGQSDLDGDGVNDDVDDCPNTAAGLPVDLAGCDIFNGATEGIRFLLNSAELTASAVSALEQILQVLRDNPDINVTIEAHTDNSGNAEDNLQLSRRRALAVARYLVDGGISGLRLRPQAFGESQPRASNATAEGRAANRRVEFATF